MSGSIRNARYIVNACNAAKELISATLASQKNIAFQINHDSLISVTNLSDHTFGRRKRSFGQGREKIMFRKWFIVLNLMVLVSITYYIKLILPPVVSSLNYSMNHIIISCTFPVCCKTAIIKQFQQVIIAQ